MSDDPILNLAEEIYADYEATERARIRGQHQAGALAGLGFEDWILPGDSYLDPDTPRRQQKILLNLSRKPYAPELFRIGLAGHPRRKVERKCEWLKFYANVDTRLGQINWGLGATRGHQAVFEAKYDRMELIVLEGSEVVAKAQSATFENANSLHELGLTDDDYRFQVGARNDDWGYTGKWFDWAIVDGKWKEIAFQGKDWDGEFEGSTRTHTGEERIRMPSAEERASAYFAKQRREQAARPRAHVVRMAERYFASNARKAPAFGVNWYRVLLAFGESAEWHGDRLADEPAPTEPYTAAEARESQKRWSGWKPFADELERLEGLKEAEEEGE